MSRPAVVVADLGKRYRLGQRQGGYQLLSENVLRRVRSLRSPEERPRRRSDFWALDDISFEVEPGESFGIIGHNGAGKSTLLKILSRVTAPTRGEVMLDGRVGALLEVGTGFHPELTGGENIYLNGAVLGMRKAEIDRRFDQIVEFAEVEQFVDTPVKRYSSGMYLRLAFAVAAHLEPEILIIDEVLSVGDVAFQEKCLGRMEEVTGEGRTVLFVSHNLSAVSKLCERSMLLSGGRKEMEGPTTEVIQHYVRSVHKDADTRLDERTDRDGNGRLRFTSVGLEVGGESADMAVCGQGLDVVLAYVSTDGRPLRNVNVAVAIYTVLGELMMFLYTSNTGTLLRELPAEGGVRCHIPRCPLPPGRYVVNLSADIGGEVLDWIQRASELTVVEGDFFGSGRSGYLASHRAVLVDHAWRVEERTAGEDIPTTHVP